MHLSLALACDDSYERGARSCSANAAITVLFAGALLIMLTQIRQTTCTMLLLTCYLQTLSKTCTPAHVRMKVCCAITSDPCCDISETRPFRHNNLQIQRTLLIVDRIDRLRVCKKNGIQRHIGVKNICFDSGCHGFLKASDV